MEQETPAKPEIAVLLIEDNDAVTGILEGNRSTEFAVTRLQNAELALPLLQASKFDAVLLSIEPSHDAALQAVSHIVESAAPVPVIALGQLPEADIAVDLLRVGAEDYLLKSEAALRALPRIIRYAVERHRLSDRLRRASDKRTEIQSLLGAILNTISTPVLIANDERKVVMANPAVTAQFGWQRQEIVGRPVSGLVMKADAGTARFQCKDATSPIPIRLSSVEVKIENRQWLVIACHQLDKAFFGGFDFGGSFEQGLTVLLQRQAGHLVAGRVQMVSVDEIRERLGDYWESAAERIYAKAESVIRSRLAPEDVFKRVNEGQFIVCFGQLSDAEARAKAQTIQKEIRDKLLGSGIDPGLAKVEVDTQTVEVSEDEANGAGDLTVLVAAKLARAADRLKRDANRLLVEVLETGQLQPRPILTASGAKAEFEMAFFDAKTQAMVDQIGIVRRDDTKTLAQIDTLMVGRAVEHLLDTCSRRDGANLITPLHFSTLEHRHLREKILVVLRQLPPAARESLVLSIRDIPETIWPARVAEILGTVRPFSRMRMVHLDRMRLGNIRLQEANVSLVGVSNASFIKFNEPGAKSLGDLVKEAHAASARVLVDSVPDQEAAFRLSQTGVDLLAYVLSPEQQAPTSEAVLQPATGDWYRE